MCLWSALFGIVSRTYRYFWKETQDLWWVCKFLNAKWQAGNQLIETLQGGLGHHTFVGRSLTALSLQSKVLTWAWLLTNCLTCPLTDDFLLSVMLGSISICILLGYYTSNCISKLCHDSVTYLFCWRFWVLKGTTTSTVSWEISLYNNVV